MNEPVGPGPIPPSPNVPPPGWNPEYDHMMYRRTHPHRTAVKVVAGVVILVMVVVVSYLLLIGIGIVPAPHPPVKVDVTQVIWSDQNSNTLGTGPGTVMTGGGMLTESLTLRYSGCFLFCGASETVTMGAVVGVDNNGSTSAPWTYTSSNLPLVVPAGQSGVITVTVQAPDETFDGVVGIEIVLTS